MALRTTGAAASQASTAPKTSSGGSKRSGWKRHGAPAGSRRDGHVDDGVFEMAAQAGIDRDPVVVEQQGALEAAGREPASVSASRSATVSAESVNPLTSIQPSGSRDGSRLARQAVARRLEAGKGPLGPDERAAVAGRVPGDELVDRRTIADRLDRDQAAKAHADRRDTPAAGRVAEPGRRGRGRLGPGREAPGIGRHAGAVAGAREVEAQCRMAGVGEVLGPRPAGPVRRHVVPAPGRTQQHGRGRRGVGGRPVVDREHRPEGRSR